MSGTKGRSGGAREGSGPKPKPKSDVVDAFSLKPRGHPVGVPGGGHDGRQPGAVDKQPNPARIIPMAEKWNFAETSTTSDFGFGLGPEPSRAPPDLPFVPLMQ